MEREDLLKFGERTLQDCIAHPPADAASFLVRTTSGTSTGKPIIIASGYAAEAPPDMAEGGSKRVLSCLGPRVARLANTLIVSRAPASSTMQVLQLDAHDLDATTGPMLQEYGADMLYGVASFLTRASAYMTPAAAQRVRRIMFVGEMLTEDAERFFRDKYPLARQEEFYIAHEVGGYVGTRACAALPRNHFHPAKGVHLDIDQPDETGIGDLLITKKISATASLERYRIGDLARWAGGACECGAASSFALVGRKGVDYIKLAGAILRREEFDRVIALFPGMIDDYRLDARGVYQDGTLHGSLRMRIYRRGGAGTPALADEIAQKISRHVFLTQTATLERLVAQGLFEPLSVEFVSQPFTQGHKDVKLRLLLS